jgi:TfoX/Sxy family transcriptional regulator of competence genes
MSYHPDVAARLRQFFSGRGDIVEKRMVGGLSFLVNGHMCCGVTSSSLMVRVGPGAYEQALAEPHVRPMQFAGKPLAGYVCVDPAGVESDAAFAAWVQRGIDFVSALPAKPANQRQTRR